MLRRKVVLVLMRRSMLKRLALMQLLNLLHILRCMILVNRSLGCHEICRLMIVLQALTWSMILLLCKLLTHCVQLGPPLAYLSGSASLRRILLGRQ